MAKRQTPHEEVPEPTSLVGRIWKNDRNWLIFIVVMAAIPFTLLQIQPHLLAQKAQALAQKRSITAEEFKQLKMGQSVLIQAIIADKQSDHVPNTDLVVGCEQVFRFRGKRQNEGWFTQKRYTQPIKMNLTQDLAFTAYGIDACPTFQEGSIQTGRLVSVAHKNTSRTLGLRSGAILTMETVVGNLKPVEVQVMKAIPGDIATYRSTLVDSDDHSFGLWFWLIMVLAYGLVSLGMIVIREVKKFSA